MRNASTPHMMQGRRAQAGGVLTPVLSVLTILAVGVAAGAIYLQIQERGRRVAVERDLTMAQSERDDLTKRLTESDAAKSKLAGDVAKAQDDLKDAQDRLAKATSAQEELARSVESREQEIARLRKDADQARNDQQRAMNELADIKRDRESVRQQLADLQDEKGKLESKVQELSSKPSVELDRVVVGSGSSAGSSSSSASIGAPAMPVPPAGTTDILAGGSSSLAPSSASGSATGQVVVVNREYDFIVMNLGKNHGLSVGQEFQILRGSQVLGQAKVEKVYDELSAAALSPDSQKDNIREGDEVRSL